MGADKGKSSPDLNSVDWTLTTSAGDSEGGIIPSQVSYHDLQVLRQSPHLHTKLSQQSTPTSSYTAAPSRFTVLSLTLCNNIRFCDSKNQSPDVCE